MQPAMPSDRGAGIGWVLDTDTVTYLQSGRTQVLLQYSEVGEGRVATSVVTMSEQLRGWLAAINRARTDEQLKRSYDRLRETQQFYCRIPVLALNDTALRIARTLVNQRVRIGTQDLRIAAIALAHNVTLVTSNQRDFARVPGLQLEDWSLE